MTSTLCGCFSGGARYRGPVTNTSRSTTITTKLQNSKGKNDDTTEEARTAMLHFGTNWHEDLQTTPAPT